MRMGIGLGVGINRSNYAQGIFGAYSARVVADGGVVESGTCVDAVSSLLQSASLLLIPSGYKGGKLYAEIPTNGNGDLTWTRGSDAFRTNASGVIQRVPWNLVQQSETFENAVWLKYGTGTLISNTTTAPNGTTTADKFIPNGANSQHSCEQNMGTTSGAIVMSLYAKADGYNWLCFNAYVGGNKLTWFNISTGTIGTVASGVSASIENAGNGWYRCIVSLTGGANTYFSIIPSNANNVTTFAGDGTSGILLWGAQLVEGTTAQTYLPTTDRLNFPRLSYMYGSCPSALLEPQRTNFVLQSQDFDNAWWSKLNATITANSTTAPDGTTTADTLDDGTSSSTFHRVLGTSLTITAGSTYSYSIYVKKNTMRYVRIVLNEVSDTFKWFAAQFDLDNATATTGVGSTAGSTVVSSSITSVGNGWYRCTLVGSMTITTSAFPIIYASDGTAIASGDSRGSVSYTGTNKQLYLWGAQLELGAYPTTYIPTTSSATATRVADSFSRNNIYTNGLISASGGTWFVELRGNIVYTRDAGNTGIFIGDDTNATNSFRFRTFGGGARIAIVKSIATVESTLFITTTDTVKFAIKWNGSTADVFVNGTKQVSGTLFTTTAMEFLMGNANDCPKFIQQMALHPEPLTDAKLIELTTL